jgi:phage repressor protein C with HTH and peptisase S24 domain
MLPAFRPGQFVVGVRPRTVKPGDVVIVRHDALEKIKRVKKIEINKIFITGDNPAKSSDSREFGWLDSSVVVARIIWPRPDRSGTWH